jgi:hypothetical protein
VCVCVCRPLENVTPRALVGCALALCLCGVPPQLWLGCIAESLKSPTRDMTYIPNACMFDAIKNSDFFQRTGAEADQETIKSLISLARHGALIIIILCWVLVVHWLDVA